MENKPPAADMSDRRNGNKSDTVDGTAGAKLIRIQFGWYYRYGINSDTV